MTNDPISPADAREAVRAVAAHGNQCAAARALAVSRGWIQRRLKAAEAMGITAEGEVDPTRIPRLDAPAGGVARYLLTAAQSATRVHPEFWRNLTAFADHVDARIMVARLRYNHSRQQAASEKTNGAPASGDWYAPEVLPYLADHRVEIAPGLIWAGDFNVIPTAGNPLSGLDSFGGLASVVIPHTQIALRSVATHKADPVKINYTTGAVTLANYIQRTAGKKAEFHHAFGALLVEVDAAGDWFCRQINADASGAFYDLDRHATGGEVTGGHQPEAFTAGDLHGEAADPEVLAGVWGAGGLVDTLRPRAQVFHDVLNFGRRSHHLSLEDRLRFHALATESVEGEIAATAGVLCAVARPWAGSFVVKANHDEHFDRWIREADWRSDPVNAVFYLEAAAKWARAKRDGEDFDLAEWALKRAGAPEGVTFLRRDESLSFAGVDHSGHGDLGPNGARGTAANIARTGRKTVIGHGHGANIVQGAMQVGVSCRLDMGYNRGPSNWSHSHALTYPNGKRVLLTQRGRKWRAAA
ncbi:MAG: hypothetical protein AAF192_01150 [Pseudomonadota bacterium]